MCNGKSLQATTGASTLHVHGDTETERQKDCNAYSYAPISQAMRCLGDLSMLKSQGHEPVKKMTN